MCECQPDIVLFAEFQPPLFRRYDLAVEFLRRRRRVKEVLTERWGELRSMPDGEITAEVSRLCAIDPLRLAVEHQRLVVEPSGYAIETGKACHFYRTFIPFAGDAELWDLSPGPGAETVEAEGAISYLEYSTWVLETEERSALKQLANQIQAANRIIALQEGRVRLFNNSLPATVERELRKRRAEREVWWEAPAGSA
jgi:hypothetical protein